eukprot:CAMPEP_0198210540 /NCGR_PEP_ID=MMETSP1445-20131203/20506_1 /TAXON_ID=36898 /ORGANISM="Pyramimonas sp., Strain CCMP2087" /LENGTH=638 /DNA_ID=CAMNT_0043884623 /DNA_START=134 /DNA_END=2050 /DNA_ORIENTATION=+
MRAPSTLVFLCSTLLGVQVQGFYLPGVAPQDYARDDTVNLKVNKLSSTKTQLPYDYYSLPYCRPDPIVKSAENLGEVLRGDRIENSLYHIEIRLDEQCKVVCKIDALTAFQAKHFNSKIDDEYRVNMILDNLPVGMVKIREENGLPIKTYERGYPVGFKAAIEEGGEQKHFLHNHLRFTILYHKDIETDLARIVGFEVEPFSVKHEYEAPWDPVKPSLETCHPGRMQYVTHGLAPQMVQEGEEVIFSYDVVFKMSNIRWASRWDTYLLMMDDQIHWFSIVNSLMIVVFLSGMVAMIMLRTLHRDISKYNQLETVDEASEETGWKLVHGDVFRPPTRFGALTVYVGTGGADHRYDGRHAGVRGIRFSLAIEPRRAHDRDAVAVRAVRALRRPLLRALVQDVPGHRLEVEHTGRRVLVPQRGVRRVFCPQLAHLGPEVVGGGPVRHAVRAFFPLVRHLGAAGVYRELLRVQEASGGRPRADQQDPPTDSGTNVVHAPVSRHSHRRDSPFRRGLHRALLHPDVDVAAPVLLPVRVPFHRLRDSHRHLRGDLHRAVLLPVVQRGLPLVVEVFLTAGSSAIYLFAYSAVYFGTKLDIAKSVSGMLYFGYMFIISLGFFLLTGTIGFYSCFFFVRTIYAAVKID